MVKKTCLTLLLTMLFCNTNDEQKNIAKSNLNGTFIDLDKIVVSQIPQIISVTSPVDLAFNTEVIPPHQCGIVLDKSPFTFHPPIAGEARWLSQTQIQFTPSEHLKPGITYKGLFKGKTAFGDQCNVNDYEFTFKTAEQEVLSFNADFSPDTGKNMVMLKANLVFAQPFDLSRLKKDLLCKADKKRMEIIISQRSTDLRIADISVGPLKRGTKPLRFTFTLPGSYKAEKKEWQKEIFLPEASAFRVISHSEMGEAGNQRVYGFRFSDPLKKGMDLSGYVSIEPPIDYTVSADGRNLKVQAEFIYGNKYRIRLSKGLPGAFGTGLTDDYDASLSFSNLKPEIRWLSKGIYLPSDNQFRIQLKSVNVSEINVTVTEIFENNLGFFLQNNILYDEKDAHNQNRYEYFSPHYYGDLNRTGKEIYNKKLKITDTKNKWITTEFDLSEAFSGKKNSAFVVSCRFDETDLCGRCINDRNDFTGDELYYEDDNYYSNPCQYGYYYRHGTVSKLLIASDIALTLKTAKDGIHVYAVNALKAQPVSGLRLALFSYQNQILERATTDNNGHALFRATDGYYIRGEEKGSLTIMRLDHPSWELSSYDIAGVDEGKSGTDVFMYTDRGVYRPGDTVHLSAIIRSERKIPPENQIVYLKVKNPLGQIAFEEKKNCGKNGHLSFSIPSDISAPTGNYVAELKTADNSFTKVLKVETVKPNRLKVNIGVADTIMDSKGNVSGNIESKYLFGAPAAGLRAVVNADYSAVPLNIPTLRDYSFGNPLLHFTGRRQKICDTVLDTEGKLQINHSINDINKFPELLNAHYQVRIYERGGDFTAHSKNVLVIPYSTFVGIKNVFLYGSAATGQTYQLPIVLSDFRGQLVAGRKLKLRWYLNKRYWWYDYDNHDRKDFRTSENTYKIAEFDLISSDKPVLQKIEVDDEGQHFIEVVDEQSGHSAGLFFWASPWGEEAIAEKAKQPLLPITADKNVYYTGDKAVFSFETPKEGLAIFTIEQGSRILHQEVRKVKQGRTGFTIDITDEYVPNCYASVSLIQPANRSSNDLPLRIYGLKLFTVEDQGTRLKLTLQAPEEIKSNSRFEIKVNSTDTREGTFTIAVVDEGLLDLTGFGTPDIWNHFFQKRRLSVLTRDNFEEILSALIPGMDKKFSIGGDLGLERSLRAGESRVQRFKPVVLFSGPVSIKPGSSSVLSFNMPNYTGSVRIMVVGSAQNSYVSLEKTVPVRQELMILTTVPRVTRPGDLFSVPVSVFSASKDVKDVKVGIRVSGNLTVQGSKDTAITFDNPGEKDLRFMVNVGKSIGKAALIVNAVSGKYRTSDTTMLPVTAANSYYIRVSDTSVSSGKDLVITPKQIGIEGTNRARIAISRFPDIQIDKRLKDLIRYPYGCLEQMISGAFPQLYLSKLVDLKDYQNLSVTDNVNAAINRLQTFCTDGGFSYWPPSQNSKSEVSDWGSDYAGHFLIEARKAGYHVPDNLYNHWLNYAQSNARKINIRNFRYQTYTLFLLSLAGKPDIGTMNLVRENHLDDLDPLSRKLLAGTYFLAGQKDAAEKVAKHMTTEITSYRESAGTYGSALRDQCLMAYISQIMGERTEAMQLMRSIAHQFKPQEWYSTQENAFALIAICEIYGDKNLIGSSRSFSMEFQDGKTRNYELQGYQISMDISDYFDKPIKIKTDKPDPLYVSLFEEGIPVEDIVKTGQKGLELTRNFYDDQGNPIPLESISQGDQFWVRYQVRSTAGQPLKELALSSIFPSGWEIVNTRMVQGSLPPWISNISVSDSKYMDIRDDRVNWFFDLNSNTEANFIIKCNATFAGAFRLPPVTVEPMYSPDFYARIESGTITVK